MCRSDLLIKQVGEKARDKKHRVYVVFVNLEKAYDRQMLRMHDVGGKLLTVQLVSE